MLIGATYAQQLPIKTARTISFTTDEGSYMDADLSPDGKTIVFDILGDIYTVPSTGGNATQLTHGLAYNRYPVWSPDGKRIAFLSDASGAVRLNMMNSDGSGERTLDTSELQVISGLTSKIQAVPAWTPDGQFIAVNDLLYHLTGVHTALPAGIKANVQFSPDGRSVYYNENNGKDQNVDRYDRHSGSVTKLATIPIYTGGGTGGNSGWLSNQSISPDGQWLAYVALSGIASDLRLHNLVSGEDRLLKAAIEDHRRCFSEHFSFSSDSHSIVIGFGGKLHRIDIANGADLIIPFKANVKSDLGAFDYHTFRVNDQDSLQVRLMHSANISPDGKSLVFEALDRIYTMQLPDGKPRQLVKQPFGQFQPVYSPDGQWIAYVTWSDTQGGAVWRVPAFGGKPEQLSTDKAYYNNLAWSPDGRLLAVFKATLQGETMSFGSPALQLIDIAAKSTRKLADNIASNAISFSRDGQKVITMITKSFDPRKGLTFDLAAFSQDGTKEVLASRGRYPLIPPGDNDLRVETLSPDGRYMVYGVNEDLYLVPLPGLATPVVLNSADGIKPIIRFASGGYDPIWRNDGKVLGWTYGNHYYESDPDKIMRMAEDSSATALNKEGIFKVQVVPDRTVFMDIKAAKQYAPGTIALRNVRIISMKGDEITEHGTIVITDGRIETIGQLSSTPIPSHAKIYDLPGKTVMPGMIDLHNHMKWSERTGGVFTQQSWNFLADLAYGVTTARNPAASFDEFAYAEMLQTGQMCGPRLFSVGFAVGEGLTVHSLQEARETIRKRAELGAITVKQYNQESRLQRQWVLMACKAYGLNMTNEGDWDPRVELAMMKDGSTGVEHAYGWGKVYSDVIHFVAKSGTWHTPTLNVINMNAEKTSASYFTNLYRRQPDQKLKKFWPEGSFQYKEVFGKPYKTADTVSADFVYTASVEARINQEGGHIGVGAHGNYPGIGTHWELWALQMGGLSNLTALREATIGGAEALGVQQDLGSLEPGKIADLIVLEKNPLDDIHNTTSIKYVMKDGVLYQGDTLDEIWPVKKKLPTWRLQYKDLQSKEIQKTK